MLRFVSSNLKKIFRYFLKTSEFFLLEIAIIF